ncbi:KEOPS complex subunit Pcc1 [Salinirussus salinus]|uniref:KEOPS complex subunit Pcc1 n=1 Tax=Salinirussus salinus TaxID=1198300 RepID=UPI00135B34DD|nr:KEOPS complex subunit Pcc1 [Salinirussus salinus]
MNEAVFSAVYDTPERARRVERALRPEVGDIDGDRTTVGLAREGDTLEVTVRATDLTALRAGLNTWLGLVDVAERAGGAGGSGSTGGEGDSGDDSRPGVDRDGDGAAG